MPKVAQRTEDLLSQSLNIPKTRAVFVCAGDPEDSGTWSGTPSQMLTHLRAHFEIVAVVRRPWAAWFVILRRVARRLTRGKVELYWSPFWARLASKATRRAIIQSNADLVFCVAISPICALLSKDCRTVFISDATVAGLIGYNPTFSALSNAFKQNANAVETAAVSGALAAFYPSEWARADAIRYHHIIPERAHFVHWGANLVDDGSHRIEAKQRKDRRLLFVGVNWRAKGGDIAVAAVNLLRERGLKVHLDVVGSAPDGSAPASETVTYHGFLDKNDPLQRAALMQVFRGADLLLFPTKYEALGIVSAEAAAFGIPTIAFRTGGVSANVIDGETGILLKPDTTPVEWANTIFALLTDEARYTAMSRAASIWSARFGNWRTWAESVSAVLATQTTDSAGTNVG